MANPKLYFVIDVFYVAVKMIYIEKRLAIQHLKEFEKSVPEDVWENESINVLNIENYSVPEELNEFEDIDAIEELSVEEREETSNV